MTEKVRKAVEEYQCSGCVWGSNIDCYKKGSNLECVKHVAGTRVSNIGRIFLGMPTGFNRFGAYEDFDLQIFESFEKKEWVYNLWNIPSWKWLSKDGHTFVRGLCPRVNQPFLHVILEDCVDKIDCYEITASDLDGIIKKRSYYESY